MKIGFLHPGSMGVSIAAAAIAAGNEALWASGGRGPETSQRAAKHGLTDVGDIATLARESEIIMSICPPAAALSVAKAVADVGFTGIFVDCNAISPGRMEEVAAIAKGGGAQVVDGCIVGPPAWDADATFLHLSGPARASVASCFSGSVLGTETMSDRIGEASALKMCFAALTKGTAALLSAIVATAEEHGVGDALNRQWDAVTAGRSSAHEKTILAATPKAWRWVDEMEEIAATFEGAGQPAGFHRASADIFRRLSDLKDGGVTPDAGPGMADVLARLRATK